MLDEGVSSATEATNDKGPVNGGSTDEFEPLACLACRSRKLKCDRAKPACARCLKLKADCTYPESRRKPAFKRRNVKDLAERLAQVEVLLKDAAGKIESTRPEEKRARAHQDHDGKAAQGNAQDDAAPKDHVPFGHGADGSSSWTSPPGIAGLPFEMPDMQYQPRAANAGATSYELLGLGLFEALPPAEMIEELHQAYFMKQHPLIPILHPARYMQSFYSAPHRRPPMCLQYAVWTIATLGHEKYSHYHDVFHRRCRHYLEEDELKGDGEHFLTVAHAQAWALVATAEARNMWFTKAAMSASRCIKLLHMMGLHRLDDPNAEFEMMPTILPPKDWIELEERRRVFWGAFSIDSHASISTGWPTLIDADEVTTHLPSSEEAFNQGREEETCRLHDVFTGSSYSSFAATAVVCHLFNRIMKHANRSQPSDCAEDFAYGKYWNRHRELDNLLSGAFMFLPERFRLPQNVREPVAIHTNLNLHAAVICLHNSAYEMANEHNLPEHLKTMIKTRLLSASNEVVNILKLTSHTNAGYRSPLIALAFYVASSVYTSQAQEEGMTPIYSANIEFLYTAMEAIGKQNRITLAFLRQAIAELKQAGLESFVRVPKLPPQLDPIAGDTPPCGQIPLFARSRVSKRTTGILPPLPGRLPLNKPLGSRPPNFQIFDAFDSYTKLLDPQSLDSNTSETEGRKRRRVNLSPEPASVALAHENLTWCQHGPVEELASSTSTPIGSTMSSGSRKDPKDPLQFNLPHRGSSSTSGSSPLAVGTSSSTSMSSSASPGYTMHGTEDQVPNDKNVTADQLGSTHVFSLPGTTGTLPVAGMNGMGLDMFQDFEIQDPSPGFTEVTEDMLNDTSWMMLNDVDVNGQTWDIDVRGTGVG
ncbi:hypothetical protein N0V93_005377 [Gnomoniopsis smithogilvyi]|uniref:Zn(2)-C6 fungal-type domain-containing protein n=1 Tax=Gnomoniopsis smithogilvyi TaxID=1191159 RepID=A0A9W9CWP2_9PEZI|nr:hypothetical protein N0V93_005377 [Gnomoniopsis smithogilvyi]